MGLEDCIFALAFIHIPTFCVPAMKDLARLQGYAGSTEPSLLADVINAKISCAGSYIALVNKRDTGADPEWGPRGPEPPPPLSQETTGFLRNSGTVPP